MPGPRRREIVGRNIYPQAMKKFYAWPTPKRKYRRQRLPQNHEKIICLADADEGKRINYSLKPVTNYKLKTELKVQVPHRYYEQPEAGSILQQAHRRRLVRQPELRLQQAKQDEQVERQAPLEPQQQVRREQPC